MNEITELCARTTTLPLLVILTQLDTTYLFFGGEGRNEGGSNYLEKTGEGPSVGGV
jgi:hypothetical protein